MATRKHIKSKRNKLFRRNKKSKKSGGSNKNSPANSTSSLQSLFDNISVPASPTNISSPVSPTLSIGTIISPSPKKRKLTNAERDNAYNFLQRQPQTLFTKETPLNELAALAADAIPLSLSPPSPPSSKTRKRRLPPSKTKHRSEREQIITKNNLNSKIKNKNGDDVPVKSLSRIIGFIEDFIEHKDVEKSQNFYNKWREDEANQRKYLRNIKKNPPTLQGSIDISGKQP
jgi:hypothetical protein